MRVTTLLLALVLLLASTTSADAAPDPGEALDKELERIARHVDINRQRVKAALTAKSWAQWCPAHEGYMNALNRGVIDIETAVTRYLFALMETGGTLDVDSLTAIDDAAWLAGDYAHRRVLASSWSVLVKRGIPPDKRSAALDLLARQGVYDGEIVKKETGKVSSCDPGPGANPNAGRTPGSPEAAQALSKWQYAYMRAESAKRSISMYETQLLTAPEGSKQRASIEKQLSEVKAQYDALSKSAEEWRRKYFQAGGR